MGVKELKHAALLQEWGEKIVECRSSGKSVKDWCSEQGISKKTYYYWEHRYIEKASRQLALPSGGQVGTLTRIDPYKLPDDESDTSVPGVTIRHGESSIILLAGVNAESIAELVKALNRHA